MSVKEKQNERMLQNQELERQRHLKSEVKRKLKKIKEKKEWELPRLRKSIDKHNQELMILKSYLPNFEQIYYVPSDP